METKRKVLWYIFLVYATIHFVLLPTCILFSLKILDLNIPVYVVDYISRLGSIVIIFLCLLYIFLRTRWYLDLNKVFILFLISTPLILDTLGNYLGWYDVNGILKYLWFDDLVHFVIPIFLAIAIFWLLHFIYKRRSMLSIVLASTITICLSTLWEIYEYWSDVLLKTDMVKGLDDTMLDLSFGFLGVLVFYIYFYIFFKKKD